MDETLGRHLKVAAFSSEAPGVEKPMFPGNFVPQVSRLSFLSVMTVCLWGISEQHKPFRGTALRPHRYLLSGWQKFGSISSLNGRGPVKCPEILEGVQLGLGESSMQWGDLLETARGGLYGGAVFPPSSPAWVTPSAT